MNLADTNALLTLVARLDNRRFDDATVIAWRELLGDLDLDDARQAVLEHFRTSEAYLMPVHIRRGVHDAQKRRRREIIEESRGLAIEAERQRADPRPLTDRSEEIRAFVGQIRDVLPQGDPDSLRWGRRHWRKIRERQERAGRYGPNPHYDPAVAARLAEENATEGAAP